MMPGAANRAPIRTAIVAFLVSRGIFFAMVIAGSQISFLRKVYSNSIWETEIHLTATRLRPALEGVVMVGDAWWYRSIAIRGYGPQPDRAANWGFFPLFPFLVRYARLSGDFALDGVLVSNAACFGSFMLLALFSTRAGFSAEDADRAIYYLAFFPSSYFLSLPMTESVFLFLSLATFLGAFTNRWWLAGLAGCLASMTRITGALLIVPMLLHALTRRERRVSTYAWLGAIPAGTAAFFVYLHDRTGDWLAYVHTQANWGHSASWPWQPLIDQLLNPSAVTDPWNFRLLNFVALALLVVAGIALVARRQFALGVYALVSAALPLCTGTVGSGSRYVSVIFPLFLWLAVIGRRPAADRAWFATSAVIFGWLVAFFTFHVDFALV